MELTKKQRLFVTEYLKDKNGTQAAIRAGYNKHSAPSIASENLQKPYICHAIEEKLKEILHQNEVDIAFVINGIKEIALKESAKDTDRLKAYELLGKNLKMFTDKIESENINHNNDITVKFDDKKLEDWAV